MKAFHIVGPAPLCTNTFLLVTDAGHAVAIDPAADAIIAQFQTDSKDSEAGALSNDQIQAIVNAIAGLAHKKN